MPIICFFGPDGSGKTTLAKALAERLNSRGFKVMLSWMRGTHTLASLLARLLSKFNAFRGLDNPYYRIAIPRNLKRLWQLLEFASAIPVILFRFILPSALGYWVIADRYVPDLVSWISLTTRDKRYLERIEARFLLGLSSKIRFKIHTTASAQALLQRRAKTGPNFGADELQLYERIALTIRAERLDTTNKSVDESAKELSSLLGLR